MTAGLSEAYSHVIAKNIAAAFEKLANICESIHDKQASRLSDFRVNISVMCIVYFVPLF